MICKKCKMLNICRFVPEAKDIYKTMKNIEMKDGPINITMECELRGKLPVRQ